MHTAARFQLSRAGHEEWDQAGPALPPALQPGSPWLPAVTAGLPAAGQGPGPGDTKLEGGEDRIGLQV